MACRGAGTEADEELMNPVFWKVSMEIDHKKRNLIHDFCVVLYCRKGIIMKRV